MMVRATTATLPLMLRTVPVEGNVIIMKNKKVCLHLVSIIATESQHLLVFIFGIAVRFTLLNFQVSCIFLVHSL